MFAVSLYCSVNLRLQGFDQWDQDSLNNRSVYWTLGLILGLMRTRGLILGLIGHNFSRILGLMVFAYSPFQVRLNTRV